MLNDYGGLIIIDKGAKETDVCSSFKTNSILIKGKKRY